MRDNLLMSKILFVSEQDGLFNEQDGLFSEQDSLI